MDIGILLSLAVLIILFFFSGVFSASETSLMGLGRIRLAHAIEQGGPRGKALQIWKNDPNRLLTTILILNNAVNISATTVAAFVAVSLSDRFGLNRAQMGVVIATVVTVIIIIFGEVTPKILAIHKSEKIALFVIRPLVLLEKIFRPLIRLLVAISNFFLKPFRLQAGSVPMVTEEEIHALIQMGADEGVIEDEEHQMIHGVIRLGETRVREVMVPRTDIECISASDSMEFIIDKIVQTGYSRMPVYRNNVDNIIGVIYAKDIISILQNRELIVLQDILRKPYFIPETTKVDELLHEFQRGKLHMAIVVDEYGGTSGLVTLEDLIEEIVGEIRDEYDIEEKHIERISEDFWVVEGQTEIKEINKTLEVELPVQQDINTLGGFITSLLGHLPKKEEQVLFRDMQFTILAASTRRIEKIQIHRLATGRSEKGEDA